MPANFNRSFACLILGAAILLGRSTIAAEIPWSTDIEESLKRAASNDQLVLIEFTADWCVFCKKMEKNTFTDTDVAERISRNFVAVKVDADQNKALVKDLGIKGLPAILIVSPDLNVLDRISGFQTPEALIPKLDAVTSVHPNRTRPATLASAQNPQRQPNTQEPQQKSIEFETAAPPRANRKELEFEAITQEEAPRVGGQRPVAPMNRPALHDSDSQQPQHVKAETVNRDTESFFKTISREQEPQEQVEADSGPAFGGLCIVSAVEERKLVNGTSRVQIDYRGRRLYFASPENKERFLSEPAAFWPMLDGACAITLLENEQQIEGSLEFAAVFRKRIWLFASQEAMREFLHDPADVAEEATEIAAGLQR